MLRSLVVRAPRNDDVGKLLGGDAELLEGGLDELYVLVQHLLQVTLLYCTVLYCDVLYVPAPCLAPARPRPSARAWPAGCPRQCR